MNMKLLFLLNYNCLIISKNNIFFSKQKKTIPNLVSTNKC